MPSRRTLLFTAGLAVLVWCAWLALAGERALASVAAHWEVSVTMVLGSLIAGGTSEGGGAVAFPVFTKLLHVPPMDAKVFSLAIQSVGMSAASLTILAMRVPVEWRAVLWVSLGGVPGVWLGAAILAPALPPPVVKMSFTVMVASLAVTLLALNRGLRLRHLRLPACGARETGLMLGIGLLGGVMTGLVGNGIDIFAFSLLVLLFRVSEKVATPTSVVLMAINALVGFALHLSVLPGFTATVQGYWLAAIPVVVVGAPAGAVLCTLFRRQAIARFLIALIALEVATSLLLIPLSREVIYASTAALLVFSAMHLWMYRTRVYEPA